MAIETLEQETHFLLQAVAEYRAAYVKNGHLGKLAPYGHIVIPDKSLFVYNNLLQEQAQTLANEINQFCIGLTQLNAWDIVLKQYDQEEKYILLSEFIENIAIVCTSCPKVIRSRFLFSVSHLSHQANLATNSNWKEKELPDDRQINWETMNKVAAAWPHFNPFLIELEKLGNNQYDQATKQFRNKYHHRYPPRFILGATGFVSRTVYKDGRVVYGLGDSIEPLQLTDILPILLEQHRISLICFEKYSDLVREQLSAIHKFYTYRT